MVVVVVVVAVVVVVVVVINRYSYEETFRNRMVGKPDLSNGLKRSARFLCLSGIVISLVIKE